MSRSGIPSSAPRAEPALSASRLALHLFALTAFAVAQPLFELIGGEPTFLIAHAVRWPALLGTTAALLLLPPLALLVPALLLARAAPAARRSVFAAAVAVPVGLFALELLVRATWLPGWAALAGGAAAGVAGAGLWSRWAPARAFATILIPAPLVFAGLFLARAAGAVAEGPREPAGPAAARGGTAVESPVVVLVLDQLPLASLLESPDAIDARLFPSFARLARTSTWFRNASTVYAGTKLAVPALLTGKLAPDPRTPPNHAAHPESLFTELAGGHRLVVQERVTALAPPGVALDPRSIVRFRPRLLAQDLGVLLAHVVVPAPWSERLPAVDDNWGDFLALEDGRAGTRAGDFRRFVQAIEPQGDGPPGLYVVHLVMPHIPWTHLETGTRYADDPLKPSFPEEPNDAVVVLCYQRHLLQLGFVDRLLGELLDRLEACGIFDRAAVAVVADHGVNLRRPRGDVSDPDGLQDVLRVPFFVKLPGQREARIVDRNVESIDLVPTLADAIGLRLSYQPDGASALDDAAPERAVKGLVGRAGASRSRPAPPGLPERWPALEDKRRHFGLLPTWADVYAAETPPERRGLAEEGLEEAVGPVADSAVRVEIQSPGRLAHHEAGTGFAPSLVVGRLLAGARGAVPERVALFVNGRLQAVRPPYERGAREGAFSILVPETAFVPGANRIGVYAVTADGRFERLVQLGVGDGDR